LGVVLGVVGLLLGIALPKIGRLRDAQALERSVTQVAGALRRAQSEAAKQNQSVTVTCAGSTCASQLATGVGPALASEVLPVGVSMSSTGPVTFRPFGPPAASATITLSITGTGSRQVAVEAGGAIRVR
jgi:type II secretory pathway pseudopilin PulG